MMLIGSSKGVPTSEDLKLTAHSSELNLLITVMVTTAPLEAEVRNWWPFGDPGIIFHRVYAKASFIALSWMFTQIGSRSKKKERKRERERERERERGKERER